MNHLLHTDYSLRYVLPPRTLLGRMKVLVAGDNRGTVESLRLHFFQKTCEVETAYTSEEIRKHLSGNRESKAFDIMICGFLASDDYALRIIEITRRLSDVRMLFLTGKKDPAFNTKVLNAGADDCLISPASIFELDARVLRLCHRNMNLRFKETKIVLGPKDDSAEIDMVRQTVKRNGGFVLLTKMEYRILLHFALNAGRLIPKTDLEKIIFQSSIPKDSESSGHVLNTHMCNLRKKFKTALSIKTVSCYGFVLEV